MYLCVRDKRSKKNSTFRVQRPFKLTLPKPNKPQTVTKQKRESDREPNKSVTVSRVF